MCGSKIIKNVFIICAKDSMWLLNYITLNTDDNSGAAVGGKYDTMIILSLVAATAKCYKSQLYTMLVSSYN